MEDKFKLELQNLITRLLQKGKLIGSDHRVTISIIRTEEADRQVLDSVLLQMPSGGCRKKILSFLSLNGTKTLSAVTSLTPSDLLEHPGLGKETITEFTVALLRTGVQLSPEWLNNRWLQRRLRKRGF